MSDACQYPACLGQTVPGCNGPCRVRMWLDPMPREDAQLSPPRKIWINWTAADDECPPTAVGACTSEASLPDLHSPVEYILATEVDRLIAEAVAQVVVALARGAGAQ